MKSLFRQMRQGQQWGLTKTTFWTRDPSGFRAESTADADQSLRLTGGEAAGPSGPGSTGWHWVSKATTRIASPPTGVQLSDSYSRLSPKKIKTGLQLLPGQTRHF